MRNRVVLGIQWISVLPKNALVSSSSLSRSPTMDFKMGAYADAELKRLDGYGATNGDDIGYVMKTSE